MENKYTLDDLYVLHDMVEGSGLDFDLHRNVTQYIEKGKGSLLNLLSKFISDFYTIDMHEVLDDVILDIVFVKTLEEIPLYINHDSPEVRVWVEWRLKIGK